MNGQKFISLIVTAAFFAFTFYGCKKTGSEEFENTPANSITITNNYNPPAITFSATVQGFVIDEAGNPMDNAEVKTGSKTVKTDINGYFKIDNAPFTGDFCYIKATKKGFFTASATMQGKAGSNFATELMLMAQDNIISFPAAQGKTIALGNGAGVQFPANSIVSLNGKPYTGTVNVAIEHLDPSATNFSKTIPGGDLRGFDGNNQNVQLLSYGMLNIELRDNAGNLLQLQPGKKAKLTVPVPSTMTSTAPTTIPLWYFDETKGIWIEEGKATLQGNHYIGEVGHFTPWNCDQPLPPSIIRGRVVDNAGIPLRYAPVKLDQVSSFTTDDGTFVLTVASGSAKIYTYDETGTIGPPLVTPVIQPNQDFNIGDVKIKAASKLTATVKNCDGKLLNGYATVIFGKKSYRKIITDAKFEALVPSNGSAVELDFYSYDFNNYTIKKVTSPTITETRDLDEIVACGFTKDVEYIKFIYTVAGKGPVYIIKMMPPTKEFFYKTVKNETNMRFADFTTYDFEFFMTGKNAGIHTLTEESDPNKTGQMYLQLMDAEATIFSKQLKLDIPLYANENEMINGTFSGDVTFVDHKTGTNQKATITGGDFRVKRIADKP